MSAYDDLMQFTRETLALASVAGRTGWDQETVMPEAAGEMRSEEMAALERVLHERRADPRIGDWLEAVGSVEGEAAAQLRHIRRSYRRATRVPGDLAVALARVTSVSQGEWARARKAEDWGAFQTRFAEVVKLKREEAAAMAGGAEGEHAAYDALLAEYEPGTSSAEIAALFDELRPRLVDLREAILGSSVKVPALAGEYDETVQMAMATELALGFGYDLSKGRIDKAVHPFSSGSGMDVRITTRTNPEDPFNCFYSTIHEVGHATYEQKVDARFLLTPLGGGASTGVHESQSRIYENQIARSRAFTSWLFGRMQSSFGDFGVADADAFFASVNRVDPGFIRTEADEVHYNLHVMMRFDLERDLIGGKFEVADLPEAWNARFKTDFGATVDRPSRGVLQDVHWAVGLFGYFPTYTLGNVYAGCLHKAMRDDLPDLDTALAAGDTGPATAWLREKVQQHGGLYEPRDTIARACGFEPSAEPLLEYLETKFGAIYKL